MNKISDKIFFKCPSCKAILKSSKKAGNTQGKCPFCENDIKIPEEIKNDNEK